MKNRLKQVFKFLNRKTGIGAKELMNLPLESKQQLVSLITTFNWPYSRVTRLYQNSKKNNATFEEFLEREWMGCIRDKVMDNL